MQTKFNDGSVMICGYVPNDAEVRRVGTKDTLRTTFGAKVGERPDGTAVWANCQCWGSIANYAAQIKKGDTVLAIGKLNTYTSEKTGKTYTNLECEYVAIQPKATAPAAAPAQAPTQALDPCDLSVSDVFSDDGDPF